MYINITETHPLALNPSKEVLLHFEVQWDKHTQPNAISINSPAKSIMVHRAQRHSSLQCSYLPCTCSAEDRSSAAAQRVANLYHGSQPQASPGLRLGTRQRALLNKHQEMSWAARAKPRWDLAVCSSKTGLLAFHSCRGIQQERKSWQKMSFLGKKQRHSLARCSPDVRLACQGKKW